MRSPRLGLVVAGTIIGLVGALAAARVSRNVLFDLTAGDPITYVAGVIVLGAVAILSTWLPAWRASHVDPLRAE